MMRKGVVIVRGSVWTVRELYQLHIVICVAYFQDGDGLIQVKAEDVTNMQEEDPLAVTFPAKAERGVSCISVRPAFTDIQLF